MKTIRPGQLVYWRDEAAIILELKGLTEAIARTINNEKTAVVSVSELSASPESTQAPQAPHLLAKDKDWDMAVERFELIQPLLSNPKRTAEDAQKVAKTAGKSLTTIYRWLKRFEETGLVSSLLRLPRTDEGKSRLSIEVNEIIELQIQNCYLQNERPSVLKLYRMVKVECQLADLPIPHKNTVYARARAIEEQEFVRKRYGIQAAKQKFVPLRGSFPGAKFPNAVVQIDHTKVDLIVVDEEHRLPIGRPYLTIAIDVATKMLTGFRMTLDPPSASSAGLCIAHAVLTKDTWLAKRDIHAEWPIYGKMQMIHVDNAKEFRGNMLIRACKQYGIILENRPKGQPNYGPHVERAFRTFMGECHSLPGTTFSSIKDRLHYDSEGKACLTLAELELWFTIFVVYCYHHKAHKGINNTPPIKLYNQMVHGTNEQPGVGLPLPIEDEETLRLNFTPYIERTIQRHGVVIDNIQYFAPSLRKWVASKDPENTNKKRKFIFARDPRDISLVYFLDPDTATYVPVPYFNNRRPAISLWELKAVTKKLKDDEYMQVDEEMIFKGIQKMRSVEAEAIERTRLAKQSRASEKRKRRMAEQRRNWSNVHKVSANKPAINEDLMDDEDIQPFSDFQIQ